VEDGKHDEIVTVTFTFANCGPSKKNARRLETYCTSVDPENDVAYMSDAENYMVILVPGLARPPPIQRPRSC